MKKILFLCIAALASAFTLNSCEDVPEPYKLPGSSSGETEAPVEPAGEGTKESPYNVAKALQIIKSMDADVESEEMFVKGIVTSIEVDDFSPTFGNLTYYIADTEGGSTTLYIFRSLSFNNQVFTSADQLKVGDVVVVGGSFVNFRGSKPESVIKQSRLITVNGKTSFNGEDEGDDDEDVKEPEGPVAPGITVSDRFIMLGAEGVTPGTETHRINLNAQGLESGKPVTEVKDDGCTITFSNGENKTNAPTFYDKTKGVRMYANNVVTFTADKTIASITITCDQDSKTSYVGNETRTWEVNSNTFTLTNTYTEATGGTQLRIQAVKFTFAK